jgi:hypothetical protein
MADTGTTTQPTSTRALQTQKAVPGTGFKEGWSLEQLRRQLLGKQAAEDLPDREGQVDTAIADAIWGMEEEQVASHHAVFLSCVPFAAAAMFTLWLGARSQVC